MINDEEIEKCAGCLCEALKKSEEYIALEQTQRQLADHEKLINELRTYRRRCYAAQQGSDDILPEVMRQLNEERQKLCSEKIVRDYLEAEEGWCRLIRKQYYRLAAIADLQLDFLENES